MRCGKTRTLDCLELLVPSPFRVVIPSEAVVYTVLAQRPRPTLLLDEADAIFGPRTAERYEGLRAILNARQPAGDAGPPGQARGQAPRGRGVRRVRAEGVAGIGNLPDTVADRSIPIRLKRRAPSETVARFRERTAEAEAARSRLDVVDGARLSPMSRFPTSSTTGRRLVGAAARHRRRRPADRGRPGRARRDRAVGEDDDAE